LNPFLRGRISTVDLLVVTCSDQLLLILENIFIFHKTSYLNGEVNRTDPFPPVQLTWFKLLIILENTFNFHKTSCLNEEVSRIDLSIQLRVPWFGNNRDEGKKDL
jgi:hypothetical protein